MNWVAPITDDETLEEFRKELEKIGGKYRIMFEIGIGTGMQVKDILQMKVRDVRGKSRITARLGTKGTVQKFDVPEDLQREILKFTEGRDPDSWLFTGYGSGEPLSREQAYRALRKAGDAVGLTSVGSQTMRKTWAWRYYRKTGDIYYLQDALNHASPTVTYRYIGVKPEIDLHLERQTADENEKSRAALTRGNRGAKRISTLMDLLSEINDGLKDPMNKDAWFGRADALLTAMEDLASSYRDAES